MKPSDFFIGSRQLFGFVAPGAICVSAWMLFTGQSPLEFIHGSEWGIRLIFFLGLSFVVGFVVQTMVFWLMMSADEHGWPWSRKAGGGTGDQLPDDVSIVRPFLKEDLGVDISPERVPRYCRNIALEYCTYARYRIIELESEINFMVALTISLPVLTLAWMVHDWELRAPKVLFVAALVVSTLLMRWRIPKLRRNERAMWCEKYLILRARSRLARD